MRDYYAVLGVAQDADLATIARAFRQRAMESHPDRGGSHEQMVLILEAWNVLPNATSRQRYDAARAHPSDTASQEASATDQDQARQQAEHYPRQWVDYEVWLRSIAGDFSRAEYGSIPLFALGADVGAPTARNSVSAWLFMLAGALLVAVPIGVAIYRFHVVVQVSRWLVIWHVFLGLIPTIGGAWAGMGAHRAIRWSARRFLARTDAAETDRLITTCEKCGQKLRVPNLDVELTVTCTKCRHKFAFQPNSSQQGVQTARKNRWAVPVVGAVMALAGLVILPWCVQLFDQEGQLIDDAWSHVKRGENDQAIKVIDDAIQAQRLKRSPEALNVKAVAYNKKADFERSAAEYTDVIREAQKLKAPNFKARWEAVGRAGRGDAYVGMRKYTEATADFSEAIKLQPSNK